VSYTDGTYSYSQGLYDSNGNLNTYLQWTDLDGNYYIKNLYYDVAGTQQFQYGYYDSSWNYHDLTQTTDTTVPDT